jgi:NADPH-dependent curcumin reductase CurA
MDLSMKCPRRVPVDTRVLTPHLGVLGNTGPTAYAGLLRLAEVKPGDVWRCTRRRDLGTDQVGSGLEAW